MDLINGFIEFFLGLPGWAVALGAFLLSAAEAALLLGFICPGELAVVLAGVIASRGEASIWVVAPAAVSGAMIGDSIGWWLGRRWGAPFMERRHGKAWPGVAAFLRRHGGVAVFLGRFQALLRAVMPAAAGAAGIPYRTFLPWNAASCVITGVGFSLIGFLAGEHYERVLAYAHKGGAVVLALGALVAVAVWWHVRRAVHRGLEGAQAPTASLENQGNPPRGPSTRLSSP